MPIKKKVRANTVPLIIEDHPLDYTGYPFITLIQYRRNHVLAIVDNSDDQNIKSYVLDLCGPERVDEEKIIQIAALWYKEAKTLYPLSVEFSRRGVTTEAGRIYRTYNIEFVTRVIGPLPRFEMSETIRVKRRKRKAVPAGVEVIKRTLATTLGPLQFTDLSTKNRPYT
jgi:hypothetical protein